MQFGHFFTPIDTPAEVTLSNLYEVNRIGLDMITTLQGEWRRAQFLWKLLVIRCKFLRISSEHDPKFIIRREKMQLVWKFLEKS